MNKVTHRLLCGKLALLLALTLPQPLALADPAPVEKKSSLTEDLRSLLLSAPGKPVAVALIIDVKTGEVILDLDSKKLIYPASVEKMFSTAAILRAMPADATLTTEVRATPIKNGSVATLAVIGAGDPTVQAADVGKLADQVRAKGIVRVDRLLIDASLFDDKLPRGFEEKATDAAFRAPVGALQVDASALAVSVRPGAVGQPPIVEISPPCGDAVILVNEGETIKGKKSTLGVSTRDKGKLTEVLVKGVISVGNKGIGSGKRRVADSNHFAAAVFKEALRKRGIEVRGSTVFAKAPADLEIVATRSSPKLQAIVSVTNKISHNQFAETMYKLNAVAAGQIPASAETAESAIRKSLSTLEIHWNGTVLGNGSGLYHASKVSAQTVVDLLRGMAKDPAGPNWKATLAVAGVDGTLRARMHDPATQAKVFAKTGTLDDVVGLAGYADGPQKSYVFALFFNQIKSGAGPYRAVHDRVMKRLLSQ